MEYRWLDAPFFTMLDDFSSLQGYFIGQAWFIAKIIMTLNFGLIALKYAVKGSDLKEPLVKFATAYIFFFIVISSYPSLISGINGIIFEWSYQSTYGKVAEMIQKTTEPGEMSEFWEKKLDPEGSYSDIIKVLEENTGSGNMAPVQN